MSAFIYQFNENNWDQSAHHSDQPIEDEGRGRIVGAVMERGHARAVPAIISLLKEALPGGVQGSDRLD